MSQLTNIATALSTTDRTLRRAASQGLIRVERDSARRQRIPLREQRYLQTHWPLLRDLRAALRTEPSVRVAVLFGSAARGDDDRDSDVDIAVELRTYDALALSGIEDRLSRAIGRRVDLRPLPDARGHAMLWSEILLHGRVLVDRKGGRIRTRDEATDLVTRADDELRRRAGLALERVRAVQVAADKVRRRRWRSAITDILEDVPRQLTVLDYGCAAFPDPATFAAAFVSEDPAVYSRVLVLERAFGRLQNHLADLAHDGALLGGLPIRVPAAGEPRAQPAFEALRHARVIPADMTRRLVARQKVRTALEHNYSQIPPRRLYEAVGGTLVDAPRFVDLYAAWIEPFLLEP